MFPSSPTLLPPPPPSPVIATPPAPLPTYRSTIPPSSTTSSAPSSPTASHDLRVALRLLHHSPLIRPKSQIIGASN
ncbi:hypothetical protein Scep_002282 [Stephania cephalantha]|uniref:Uncharacterized protein n=1 Tax=Stephania cephalantha TaxID=152367 RepID=A0AAP0L9V8_9MAGN